MRNPTGQFTKGHTETEVLKPGTIRIRTRHGRGGEQRAYIKTEHGNWILRCRHVWQLIHGPIPTGMSIHHKDHNTLNDDPGNLELVSKAQHLNIHRADFGHKCIATLIAARKSRRWSTRKPGSWTDSDLKMALAKIRSGISASSAAREFGISRSTLIRHLSR